jgi:hypothetical protein
VGADDIEKGRALVRTRRDVTPGSERSGAARLSSRPGSAQPRGAGLPAGPRRESIVQGSGNATGGRTALGESGEGGGRGDVRLLIERGADAAAEFPPLAQALRESCDGCVGALLPKLTPPLSPSHESPPDRRSAGPATNRCTSTARMPKPWRRMAYPMLLLAAASEAQPVATVKALLDRGADLAARGPNGETALDLARRHGRTPSSISSSSAGAPGGDVGARPLARLRRRTRRVRPSPGASTAQAGTKPSFARRMRVLSPQSQTAQTVALVRPRGIAVDETDRAAPVARNRRLYGRLAGARPAGTRGRAASRLDQSDPARTRGRALSRGHHDRRVARFVRRQQSADGHWVAFAHRPPIESGDIKETASALRVLSSIAPLFEKTAADESVAAAPPALAPRGAQPGGIFQERAVINLLGAGIGSGRPARPLRRNAARAEFRRPTARRRRPGAHNSRTLERRTRYATA